MSTLLAYSGTNTLSSKDWLNASKDMIISVYTETLPNIKKEKDPFFGENIRDAIRIFKGENNQD